MCLACVVEENSYLSEEHARNGFIKNRDGAGFSYIEDNKVKIEKGFFVFEEFWDKFDHIQQTNNKAKLVHFRIANCGAVSQANCHPWRLNDRAALIHNGLFDEFKSEAARISDTGLFVETVLLPIFNKYKNPLPNEGLQWMLRKAVLGNKVAILCASGHWIVFSPLSWDKIDGVWFSNSSYKSVIYTLPYKPNNSNYYVHTKHNFKRNHVPRKKNPKYRIVGETLPLSPEKINQLTHKKGKKIKQLVYEGLVERVWDEDLALESDLLEIHGIKFSQEKKRFLDKCDLIKTQVDLSMNGYNGNKSDQLYKNWWLNKAPISSICRRDDIDPQNCEL